MKAAPLDIVLVVGELSGDQLGFKLMQALRTETDGAVHFRGTAGPAMSAEGMESLFPLEDIAVMGFLPVIARFRTIYRRAWQTINSIVDNPPDALVIIDSPDFTHAVAKRVRRRLPDLPIINYVSPSVWAWRPGRAAKMRAYVDHVLALLPFEPAAHRRLGGPACTYVGHPLIERLNELRPSVEDEGRARRETPVLLVLPGSRRSEIERLSSVFGETVARLAQRTTFELVLPAAPRQVERIRAAVASWPIKPRIVEGEGEKLAAFRSARAALAASGTVSLELALARVPHVGAYRVPALEAAIARRLIQVRHILPPNIILDERAFPEFVQEDANPKVLSEALEPLLSDTPERGAQLAAADRVLGAMQIGPVAPSTLAARIVLDTVRGKRSRSLTKLPAHHEA